MECETGKKIETDVWYIDIGCSNHMSDCKKSFPTLDESYKSTVAFGDNSSVEVK